VQHRPSHSKTITADAGYWDTSSLLDPSLKGLNSGFTDSIHNHLGGLCLPAHLATKKFHPHERGPGQKKEKLATLFENPRSNQFSDRSKKLGHRRFRYEAIQSASSGTYLRHAHLLKLFATGLPLPA